VTQPPQPADSAHPRTAEIPVVPPAPSTVPPTQVFGTSAPSAVGAPVQPSQLPPAAPQQPQGAQVTGIVPGFGTGPSAPASGRRFSYGPRARAALIGIGLVALSVLLLQLGLSLDFGTESYWSALPLWSAFASVATLVGLLAFVPEAPGRSRLRPQAGWRIGVFGLVGLALFWLLVVLPVVASDRGFLLTAALCCLGAALWIAPSRKG
jgi:hypothetical protein